MSCELHEAPESLFNYMAILIKAFLINILISKIRPEREVPKDPAAGTAYLPCISWKAVLLLGATVLL